MNYPTKIKVKLYDGIMPEKQHEGDAAFDVFVPRDTELFCGRQVVDLGFSIELPRGFAATIQPRSGLSSKGMECVYMEGQGFLSGSKTRIDADVVRGLVDSGYGGHVGAIINVRECIVEGQMVYLPKGMRIAQMQVVTVPDVELESTDAIASSSDRGENGFGSTGV